jgi:hypothetical protein
VIVGPAIPQRCRLRLVLPHGPRILLCPGLGIVLPHVPGIVSRPTPAVAAGVPAIAGCASALATYRALAIAACASAIVVSSVSAIVVSLASVIAASLAPSPAACPRHVVSRTHRA